MYHWRCSTYRRRRQRSTASSITERRRALYYWPRRWRAPRVVDVYMVLYTRRRRRGVRGARVYCVCGRACVSCWRRVVILYTCASAEHVPETARSGSPRAPETVAPRAVTCDSAHGIARGYTTLLSGEGPVHMIAGAATVYHT